MSLAPAPSSIVVQKYGGSSVANPEKIRAVAARIARTRAEGHAVVVVVSAMGDTTDELLSLARQVTEKPDRRELDMLLTAGERISMALLSLALNDLGVQAISFTGSQSGIITNDSHANARIVEVRPYRIQDELERGKVVIVAGYQGVSYRKEVTTLGRGGSDTTAVALAAALGAAWCEICSDVDGVYTADPRVVPSPRKLADLSYEEMQALAESGARVLNAQAVEFAKQKGIAIYAKSTFAAGAGTVVQTRLDAPPEPGRVAAVASEEEIVLLRAAGLSPSERLALFGKLDSCGIASRQVAEDGGALCVMVSLENAHLLRQAWDGVRAELGGRASLVEGLGTVSCVGAGIGATHHVLRKSLEALASQEIALASLSMTADRVTVAVARTQVKEAVRALHAALVS
jgi:aspartate kinase